MVSTAVFMMIAQIARQWAPEDCSEPVIHGDLLRQIVLMQ